VLEDDHIRLEGNHHVFVFLEQPDITYDSQQLRKFANKHALRMSEIWCRQMDTAVALLEKLDDYLAARKLIASWPKR
jgi:hypothetical protein